MEDRELIRAEGQKLAWYLCSFQKNSFSMGSTAKATLQKFVGGYKLPDISHKDELYRITVGVYEELDSNGRTRLWNELTNPIHLVDRAKEEGLRKLFKICTPLLSSEHVKIWARDILGLVGNMRGRREQKLLLNASGAKGFFKSTGIPLVLHLFLFGTFPQDGMHMNEDLKILLRSKLPASSRGALEELLSDCTDIPVAQNFIFVSRRTSANCTSLFLFNHTLFVVILSFELAAITLGGKKKKVLLQCSKQNTNSKLTECAPMRRFCANLMSINSSRATRSVGRYCKG